MNSNETILSFQIWRLLTASFVDVNILGFCICLYSFVPKSIDDEREKMGTIKYFLSFFRDIIFIQIIFSLSNLFLDSILYSLWPYVVYKLTVKSIETPNAPLRLFPIPFTFPFMYYPIILLVLNYLLFGYFFQSLMGIIYGFAFHYFLQNYITWSDRFVIRCENFRIVKKLSKFRGFIELKSYNLNARNESGQFSNTSGSVFAQPSKESSSKVAAFSGKGKTLEQLAQQSKKATPSIKDIEESRVNTLSTNLSLADTESINTYLEVNPNQSYPTTENLHDDSGLNTTKEILLKDFK